MTVFAGGCHCGALAFEFSTARPPRDSRVVARMNSFCRAHAALSTSDPAGSIAFFERKPVSLHIYQFGTRSADFLICAHCGVYVGARMQSPSGRFAIINVRALKPIPEGLQEAQPMNYEGESLEGRAARREQRWSPLV